MMCLCFVDVLSFGWLQVAGSVSVSCLVLIFVGHTMAAGCCGTKKQKLNNSSSVPSCNGSSMVPNGISNGVGMVALPEMCFFCFDVLYCHLYNLAPPKTPSFSNDA